MRPHARYRAFFAAATLLLAACASTPAPPVATTPPSAPATASAIELPAGEGRTILQTHCTWCHDLREVTKFSGFYDRRQWRDIVVTMAEYGAAVKDKDVEVLADYLNEHFGRR